MPQPATPEGILLVNKPRGIPSFRLVTRLRRLLGVRKIGHAGTLDPLATGVMVMLIGRKYTRLSDQLLCEDKEYVARIELGVSTDSYDAEGNVTGRSDKIPPLEQIDTALEAFQGPIQQTPPMFSAKKINGRKLYELARQGKSIERKPVEVHVNTERLSYEAPFLTLRIQCSKGCYIRSIAHDLGEALGCGAHLAELQRTRSGKFRLDECIDGDFDEENPTAVVTHLRQLPTS